MAHKITALDVARTQVKGPAHAVVSLDFDKADKALLTGLAKLAKRARSMSPAEVGATLKGLLEAYAREFLRVAGQKREINAQDAEKAQRIADELNLDKDTAKAFESILRTKGWLQ